MTPHLDTSGTVGGKAWSDLSPFCQGYTDSLIGTLRAWLIDQGELARDHALSRPPGDIRGFCESSVDSRNFADQAEELAFRHLAPSTLERIEADCARFAELYGDWPLPEHGQGFWIGRAKGKHSPEFWPCVPYLAPDGLIYLREGV